jgi:hypothetical protein
MFIPATLLLPDFESQNPENYIHMQQRYSD